MKPSEIVKSLANLLGEYIDPEKEVYDLTLEKLQTSGIVLNFQEINFNQDECFLYKHPFKRDVTFSELIQSHCLVLKDLNSTVHRSKVSTPILFSSETVELQFQSQQLSCPIVITDSLSNLQKRFNLDTKTKIVQNFFFSLPNEFQKQVSISKELQLTIKLISPDLILRDGLAKKLFLTSTQDYVSYLTNKDHFLSQLNKPLDHYLSRLNLWGIDPALCKSTFDVKKYISHQGPSDFGLKNIIDLRFLVEQFNSVEVPTLELTKTNVRSELLKERLQYFKTCLIFNIPFENPQIFKTLSSTVSYSS